MHTSLGNPGRVCKREDRLDQIIRFLHRFERRFMTELEQIQARVADLQQALTDSSTKVDTLLAQNDALITLTGDLAAQLATLGESGQIPPAALSDLLTSIDTAKTAALAIGSKADSEGAKVAAAIAADTPAAPPAPAPAPAPSQAAQSAEATSSTDGAASAAAEGASS